MTNKSTFPQISREHLTTPKLRAIWDSLSIGVTIVDAEGICRYMNPHQKSIDGFTLTPVEGEHITRLYLAYQKDEIFTMTLLRSQEPALRKTYWYKTRKNQLIHSVQDFLSLSDNGIMDGLIIFSNVLGTGRFKGEKTQKASEPVSYYPQLHLSSLSDILGENKTLRRIIAEAQAAAETSLPVMIWGESGTGKELFAQAIHKESERRDGPFVPVNCAALPETLLEGLLFGTVRGSYTDAVDSPGLLEEADGGTLLLDELNSMPLGLQAKLLRVVQEKRIRRLGAHSEIPVDVRIISILNEHPFQAIDRGVLRRDLYYRLAVVGLAIPPLRRRMDDIPLLMEHFLTHSPALLGRRKPRFADKVLQLFFEYDWPGNVRELQHVVDGSVALLGKRQTVEADNLPVHFHESYARSTAALPLREESEKQGGAAELLFDYRELKRGTSVSLKACLNEYESRCILNTLHFTGGNVAKAARILDMSPAGLRYRMKILHIHE